MILSKPQVHPKASTWRTLPRPRTPGLRALARPARARPAAPRGPAAPGVFAVVEESAPEKDATRKRSPSTFKIAVFSTKPYMEPLFTETLSDSFEQATFISAQLDEKTASLAEGFDAVCLFVNDMCGREVVKKLAEGGVKLIAMRCAGYDRVDVEAAGEFGIKVVSVPSYSPTSVAEHAATLALALNRNIHLAYNRVWQGNYALSGLEGREIHGKTVGVIGTGTIGSCFCAIMKGFGCRILASDVRENPRCVEMGVEYVTTDELLLESDIVSLHCPLLPSTFHIINRERLIAMKQTALLINVSRGGLVDTDALLDALEAGDLGGCAMDVYENEGNLFFQDFTTYTSASRLKTWDRRFAALKSYPNVLITPHSAFLTNEAIQNIANSTVMNIQQFCNGDELTNEVRLPK